MITLVGGTFNRFHRGHEQLLLAAYNTGNRVMIGIKEYSELIIDILDDSVIIRKIKPESVSYVIHNAITNAVYV